MNNMPTITMGLVAVSRDCFPMELSAKRKQRLLDACRIKEIPVVGIDTIVENETDAIRALNEIHEKNVTAIIIYLGNFGPEGPLSLLAQRFGGPVMLCAAAEESGNDLINGRGDAYCGMLNASYNCGLRKIAPYIPEYPVGTADELAALIADFVPIARTLAGLKHLKIFSFGPRPQDFLSCNAPVKPLYDIGVEIMENSELDLYDVFRSAAEHPAIESIAADMQHELGAGKTDPALIRKLAQFEAGLLDFYEKNRGASSFGIFANKCWPSFEKYFGFTPCYVNSRLAGRGIPVSCEVDIYGSLSEYMAACATGLPVTILDINNTVPDDLIRDAGAAAKGYRPTDMFMGFHCGNTPSCCMMEASLKYQLIMHRLMEPGKEPDITRGTLEGRIRPGAITLFRLQSSAGAQLRAYCAQGEVLDIDPKSFGGIGVFAVSELGRFYRHALIGKQFPHHAAVAFAHAGKSLFAATKLLGVEDISYNQPKGMPYPTENPFG